MNAPAGARRPPGAPRASLATQGAGTARSAVHAASGHRLGAAHPRTEGPADLRLVPPALAAWGAAALALGLPGHAAVAGASACALLAVVLLLPARLRGRGRAGVRTAAAMALACAAAGGGVAAAHAADVHRGPLPDLARRYAHVTAEVTVTGDPRPVRPRVRGSDLLPGAVALRAETVRVTASDGTVTETRAPVLLLVRQEHRGAAGAAAGGGERPPPAWLGLLPTTRLEVRARLAPAREDGAGGRDAAAVLRVRAGGPPVVTGAPTAVQRTAGELRSGLREASDGLPPDARALLPGLVVGDTSRIPADLDAAFRTTDMLHLLAVSGANLSILLVLLIGPPGTASRAERRGAAPLLGLSLRTTAVVCALLTAAFVVVCRPEPSVLRAAACGLITIAAIGTGRRRSLLPALAAAVLLLVLLDPWLARDFGFLLSVLATGSLLTVAPRWSGALRRRGVPGRIAEALAAAAAAQAVCAPVVAVLAAHVSLVAVPCNLLAEFLVAPATVLGFGALAAAPLSMSLAEALAWAAGWPTAGIAAVARAGASLPGAGLAWPGSWTGAVLLAALVGAVALAAGRLVRHPWLCAACAVVLLLAVLRPAPLVRPLTGWPPPGWRLAVCDVGQGDALALAAGEGAAVVVDTGPDPEPVDRCLHALGVTTVPLLVLTHFHADHVAGLPGVLRGRAVGAIQTTVLGEPSGRAAAVRREAARAGIPVVRAEPGERRRTGDLSWEVLWPREPPPPGPPSPSGEEANDSSVTLFVRSAGLTLFLPGDLEPPAQRRLLRARPDLPPVDVLKVAHHGSAHQEPELLERLRPRVALVSCGEGNPYGHPAPRTVSELRASGTAVLRTDVHGSLAVTADGTVVASG
ncbi:ComEC/Rec2 family competence protein [Streptomyces sp. URMC 125]|uniref:ComEC/Rec2 family competence protein n=1 Tax=Streptomyces sp. URMC 125 TaxID=3423419 RepID=UPI003F1D08CA